ncbi:F0F1 ATP synthase subunit epsilon [Parabacteroides bouchesdurhonensis]|uniref:F0F1 ATP synthase subunit epsilon n=1 Tax=Parabacteroides bouchesdurhonensis TaxID=1936995 RepID=UPI000C84D14D|nr:hypothetical protein [Parabacteroides bouchesdurhonensis]RHJ93500.1 hypothetical protein DW095_05120 [Bacteroides sp. AM07-16]
MNLEILSPEGVVYQGNAESVSFPGVEGQFDVLPKHAPLIAALTKGVIVYSVKGIEQKKEVEGGFVEIKDDHLSVCIE